MRASCPAWDAQSSAVSSGMLVAAAWRGMRCSSTAHRGHASLSGGTALASVRSDRMVIAMSSCNARGGRVQAVVDMRGPDEPLASQQACEAAGGRCLVLVESKLRCFTA